MDKGYYSYNKYQLGTCKYKIVPFIFPKENFNKAKFNDQLSYLLQVFNKTNKILDQKQFYNNLKVELFKKSDNWKKFKPIRRKIEDFFKLLKQGLNLREMETRSKICRKNSIFKCILGVLIISQGFYSVHTTTIRKLKNSDHLNNYVLYK